MHPSSDPGVSGSRESLETHPKLQNEENCKETSDKITQLPTSATITQLPASATITQTPTSATITQLHTSATITQLHTSATITQLHTSDTITQLPTSATITQLPTSATITQLPTPADVISAISDIIGEEDLTLIIEPGRSLIGNAGIVAAKVIGCKENGNRRFIVTDVSMTEVIRPSLYGAYQHINLSEPSRASDDAKRVYDVVGPVCESADFIGKDRSLPTPHEGCGLAVFDAGAYCGCAASNYNMRVRPAEVLVDGDSWRLIRRQETFQDLIRPYTEIQAATDPTNP